MSDTLHPAGEPLPPFPPAPTTAEEARENFVCARTAMRSQSWRACVAGHLRAEAAPRPDAWGRGGSGSGREPCLGCPAGAERARLLGPPDTRPWSPPRRQRDGTEDGQPDATVRTLRARIEARESASQRRRRRAPTRTATAARVPGRAVTEQELAALLAPESHEGSETMPTTETTSMSTATAEGPTDDPEAPTCIRCRRPRIYWKVRPPTDERLMDYCGKCLEVARVKTPRAFADRVAAMVEYLRTHPSVLTSLPTWPAAQPPAPPSTPQCETCRGTGEVDETLGGAPRSGAVACPDCDGRGAPDGAPDVATSGEPPPGGGADAARAGSASAVPVDAPSPGADTAEGSVWQASGVHAWHERPREPVEERAPAPLVAPEPRGDAAEESPTATVVVWITDAELTDAQSDRPESAGDAAESLARSVRALEALGADPSLAAEARVLRRRARRLAARVLLALEVRS